MHLDGEIFDDEIFSEALMGLGPPGSWRLVCRRLMFFTGLIALGVAVVGVVVEKAPMADVVLFTAASLPFSASVFAMVWGCAFAIARLTRRKHRPVLLAAASKAPLGEVDWKLTLRRCRHLSKRRAVTIASIVAFGILIWTWDMAELVAIFSPRWSWRAGVGLALLLHLALFKWLRSKSSSCHVVLIRVVRRRLVAEGGRTGNLVEANFYALDVEVLEHLRLSEIDGRPELEAAPAVGTLTCKWKVWVSIDPGDLGWFVEAPPGRVLAPFQLAVVPAS